MSKKLTLLFLIDAGLSLFSANAFGIFGLHRFIMGVWSSMSPGRVGIFLFVTLITSYLVELYSIESHTNRKAIAIKVSMSFMFSLFGFSVVHFLDPFLIARVQNTVCLAIFCILQFSWHLIFMALLRIPQFASKVLVLGTGPLAEKIGGVIMSDDNNQHILSGYYQCTNEPVSVTVSQIVKNGDGLRMVVQREKPQKIVVSVSDRRGTLPISDILHCKFSGIEVFDAPSFYEKMTGKLLIENMRPSLFIFDSSFRITPGLKIIKRMMDIFVAAAALVIAAPLIPVIAIAIKLDSKGPVLFKQTRVGEKDEGFKILKFRTMRTDAENGTGAVWASKNDPRVTRLGRFLRKSRLDEIMQLFNVLKGDMSFVGPRPERPEFVEELRKAIPFYSERHFVKPGITGWAQVRFPYGASIEDSLDKLRYDLYYIKNISMFMDLYIICETAKVVLFRRGGR
ncbi:MAG: TIGR03013 family PEP-CTERM/XrtA system glycosyltransferase [Nitrospiraceae bacterium]|nr:TIGR03013 family PEP-CTERM/XrtA system glycosyltransferase [Nitrospiraceae bacterium]